MDRLISVSPEEAVKRPDDPGKHNEEMLAQGFWTFERFCSWHDELIRKLKGLRGSQRSLCIQTAFEVAIENMPATWEKELQEVKAKMIQEGDANSPFV